MAEAKGLSPLRIFLRYAMRNAMLPQVTGLALTFGGNHRGWRSWWR